MLAAAQHRKCKSKLAMSEDLITSTVFGPLEFLPPRDLYDFFGVLVLPKLIDKNLWPKSLSPTTAEIAFWKRFDVPTGGSSEPDLRIDFKGRDLSLTIIIEVKWGKGSCQHGTEGPENIPNQLIRQWSTLDPQDQERAFHIYLVEDKEKARDEIDKIFGEEEKPGLDFSSYPNVNRDLWRQKLVCLSWRELAYRIAGSITDNSWPAQNHLSHWTSQVSDFLSWQGIPTFAGFKYMLLERPIPRPEPIYFWRNFKGFQSISSPFPWPLIPFRDPVFFRETSR